MNSSGSTAIGHRVRALPQWLHDRLSDGLRGVRHDTANLLVAIYAAGDLLADQHVDDPRSARLIARMRRQAQSLGTLLESTCAPAVRSPLVRSTSLDDVMSELATTVASAGAQWVRAATPARLAALTAELTPTGCASCACRSSATRSRRGRIRGTRC